MMKKIANTISKTDYQMAGFFLFEIGFFILAGTFLAFYSVYRDMWDLFISFLCYLMGLFFAFTLGEAIRIRERRKK